MEKIDFSEKSIQPVDDGKESVWMRLGGNIRADEETMRKILQGDTRALLDAIRENGFQPNGDSYIPTECLDELELVNVPECDEIVFDINPDVISLKTE